MSLKYEIAACYGVQNYLSKLTGDVYSEKKANKVMIAFLESKGLSALQWSNRHKGVRTAATVNASVVQKHWADFKQWSHINLPNQ